jgi:NADPH:quinone reductase-like Zn-dependent oxidoreductase
MLQASFKGVCQLYEDGILAPRIDKVFSQNELDKAHTYVEDRKTIGKVVVRWDSPATK